MRLVCLSDTHGLHDQLMVPAGDVLLHAGDFTRQGKPAEITAFNEWLAGLPHRHKVLIAGNHDFLFEDEPAVARALLSEVHYLEDSGVELEGLHFWGSPVSPRFFDWAFNRSRGAEIAAHWAKIPAQTDILLTHGPPQGVCDKVWLGRHVGCEALAAELRNRLHPSLLVCGHIHESAGHQLLHETHVINASSLDRRYHPTQPIWVIEMDGREVRSVAAHPLAPFSSLC